MNDQLAEVQLAVLRGQNNPHFIFNALNSIKKFVIANEPDNAEKYLGKFSKLIRSILNNSRLGMVTNALLWTLQQGLGEFWNDGLNLAWTDFYETLSSIMMAEQHNFSTW